MLELLKSLVFAVIMVPVVMAIILGLIYGLGEVFNYFFRYRSERPVQTEPLISPNARSVGRFCYSRSCFSCRYFLCLIVNGYE